MSRTSSVECFPTVWKPVLDAANTRVRLTLGLSLGLGKFTVQPALPETAPRLQNTSVSPHPESFLSCNAKSETCCWKPASVLLMQVCRASVTILVIIIKITLFIYHLSKQG